MRRAFQPLSILACVFVMFIAVCGIALGSGPAFVKMTTCDSGGTSTASFACSFTATTGDVLFIHGTGYSATPTTFSSVTNATTVDRTTTNGAPSAIFAWAPGTATSITYVSAAAQNVVGQVDEFSGVNTTTPIDGSAHSMNTVEGYVTTCSQGPLTPSASGDLVVMTIANSTDNASPGQGSFATSPSTTTTIEDANGTFGIRSDLGYSIYAGTSAISGTWTWSAGQESACGMALIKPSSAGPAISSLQEITRGYIYSNVPGLFAWSGTAPSWSGSLREATRGDFSGNVANNGSCSTPAGELITYGLATTCAGGGATTTFFTVMDRCCGGYDSDYPSGGISAVASYIGYYDSPDSNDEGTIHSTYPSYGVHGLEVYGIAPSSIVEYTDTSRVYCNGGSTCPPYSADYEYCNVANSSVSGCTLSHNWSAAQAKTCSSSPVTVASSGGYLTDPFSATTPLVYEDNIQNGSGGGGTGYSNSAYPQYSLIFLDDMTYMYADSMPCHSGSTFESLDQSSGAVAAQYASMVSGLTVTPPTGQSQPQYYLNACADMHDVATSEANMSSIVANELNASNIWGIDCENAFNDASHTSIGNGLSGYATDQWTYTEDAGITGVNLGKHIVFQDQNTSATGSTAQAGRMFALASLALIFDPHLIVYEGSQWYGMPCGTTGSYLNCPSGNTTNPEVHIFPEWGMTFGTGWVSYPTMNGTTDTTNGMSKLCSGTGPSYTLCFREYKNCYYEGTDTAQESGPTASGCVAVVNPTASSQSISGLLSHGPYNHTLVISSDNSILNGGTVAFNGSALPTTIPAYTGYIAFP